jgi:hypothetical protein
MLTTDGWQRAKAQFSSLWGRTQPERAEAIAGEIEAARIDLAEAEDTGDTDTAAEVTTEWRGRFRRLLAAHPEAAEHLRELLAEIASGAPPAPSVTQHATASGGARVYQAGRDQHFGQR